MRLKLLVLFIGFCSCSDIGINFEDWLEYGQVTNQRNHQEYGDYHKYGSVWSGYDEYNRNGNGERENRKRYENEKLSARYNERNQGYYDNIDKVQEDTKYSYQNNQEQKNQYQYVNLVGLGKNDTEDIMRPCALDDWQCIRQYFAKNSRCTPVYGPISDPLYLKKNTVYFPNANITLVLNRLHIKGLGSIKINEFYINKNTGNLVLALGFKNLNETTPTAFYRYKRTGKESIVLVDFTTIEFSSGTFTAVIPKIPHLQLDLAEIHADIDDAMPKYIFGPEASNSTDPDVVAAFVQFLATLPISIQESFLFQSQLLTAIYIQENICDFGLKLISV